jgi:curved DNA-binding protein CbpA
VRDLYQILGVRRAASQGEIQRAYRRKAKTSHPDGGGSVEAFSEISTAYTVLADPNRRKRYDGSGEIELARPNNLDVSAIEVIAQKLGLIIHAEHDVTSVDLAALIEQAIREDIAERNAGISSLRRAIARARRIRDITWSGTRSPSLSHERTCKPSSVPFSTSSHSMSPVERRRSP